MMALSDDEAARLAKLKAAYDALIAGSKTQSFHLANGLAVSYGPGDVTRLKAEIDALSDKASTGGRIRGAVRFQVR